MVIYKNINKQGFQGPFILSYTYNNFLYKIRSEQEMETSMALSHKDLLLPVSRFISYPKINWQVGASQHNCTASMVFLYKYCLYIFHGRYHTTNHVCISKLTQVMIFYKSSPHVCIGSDSFRCCTVATVQDETNPSSSQPTTSYRVASESAEACERWLARIHVCRRERLASETAEEKERPLA